MAHPPKPGSALYFFNNSTIAPVEYESTFSIRYLFKGRVETHVNERRTILEPGRILLVKPGSVVRSQSLSAVTGISIFMDAEAYAGLNAGCGSTLPMQLTFDLLVGEGRTHSSILFNHVVDCIDALMSQSDRDKHPDFTFRITASFLKDLHKISHKLSFISRKKIMTRLDLLSRLDVVRSMMERETAKKFSLAQLADSAAMSKYAFLRNFKEVFQLTPNKYLIKLRIATARKLLESGLDVKEVAIKCGYPDIFSFSKQFKAVTGCSPAYHRNRNRQVLGYWHNEGADVASGIP